MPKRNIISALFDVRPVGDDGQLDFNLVNNLKPVVDLTSFRPKEQKQKMRSFQDDSSLIKKTQSQASFVGYSKEHNLKELEKQLSENIDLSKEISEFGGQLIVPSSKAYLRTVPVIAFNRIKTSGPNPRQFQTKEEKSESKNNNLENFRKDILKLGINYAPEPILVSSQNLQDAKEKLNSLDAHFASPSTREIDFILENFKPGQLAQASVLSRPSKQLRDFSFLKKVLNKKLLAVAILVFGISFSIFWNFKTKTGQILEISSNAYSNLNKAKKDLDDLNFKEAFKSFALAAENFDLIQKNLSGFGSVLGFLDDITFGKLSDNSGLLQLADLVSQLGEDFSYSFNKLSEINFFSSIYRDKNSDFLENLKSVRLSLIKASRSLGKIENILASINYSLIPDSKKQPFFDFKSKVPELNDFLDKAIDYSDIIMEILGQSEPKKYLILFQNTSELRPTGGFPGTYGLAEFDKGIMKEFFVDDIYNPDGQMKENIVPPVQLQRVTPNWGMRDANWFSDFPISAKKVAEFYFKDTGIMVDGVIVINVDIVPKILKITGPVEMPDFDVVLNADNFLPKVQEEVEYKKTKGQPKQILVEFAPKFLERLSSLDKEKWLDVFSIFVEAIETKDLMAYFSDKRLERFVLENSFGGEIKDVEGDYLMVIHSNIMGSKTDAVIDNFIDLDIEKDSDDNLIHTLTISRTHKGGDTSYGFYNRTNNDYVRILVPLGSELLSVQGNDEFRLMSLVDYEKEGFILDPELKSYEGGVRKSGGVDIFQESGKTGFGFWMITKPKQTSKVVLKYKVPVAEPSNLYIQKQPGAKQKVSVKIFDKKIIVSKDLIKDLDLIF